MIKYPRKRNRIRRDRQRHSLLSTVSPLMLAVLLSGHLLATDTYQTPRSQEPRGGYLDWVFYDDLPGSERNRISHQCPGSFIDPWTEPELAADEIDISAARQTGSLSQQIQLTGDVQITQAVLRLYGDQAVYRPDEQRVELPDGGLIRQHDLAIQTGPASARTDENRFQLYDARYTLHLANLHGQAASIERDDHLYHLERSWITRCAPGTFGWSLHARNLTVNTDTDIATGYHARLHVGPVPVAYTPYIRLNLNQQRSSGFLAPQATYYSEFNQVRLSTPYYWAIAPNLDTTITPDWIIGGDGDDGAPQIAHFDQEWRYLLPTHEGTLFYGLYPGWENASTASEEWGLDLSLSSRQSALEWTLDYRDASSAQYFPLYQDEEYERTVTNRLTLGYEAPSRTRMDVRVEHQNVYGEAVQPSGQLDYVEQPGLHLRQPLQLPAGWRLQGLADWERRAKTPPDYFDLTPTQYDPLEAYRLRNRAVLSRSDSLGNWTLTQQYTGDHTYYTLPDFSTDTLDEHPREGYNRLLWDTRHRLSYNWRLTGQQSLTPFAQHEFRPLDARQTELPLMNSSVDRLRDRNRVILGSRYQWRDDPWRFTSDIQQQFNLTRELLTDKEIRDDTWTNPQASTVTWRNNLSYRDEHNLGTRLDWRPQRSQDDGTDDLSFYGNNYEFSRYGVEYTFARDRTGLRLSSDWILDNDGDADDALQEAEIAGVTPLTASLGTFGYLHWERLNEEDSLSLDEIVAGLEYDGCCWHIQLAGQRFVNDGPEQSSGSQLFDTIQISLTLKGLGNLGGGNALTDRMRQRIPTFRDQMFDTR